jgi:hypothetical protein
MGKVRGESHVREKASNLFGKRLKWGVESITLTNGNPRTSGACCDPNYRTTHGNTDVLKYCNSDRSVGPGSRFDKVLKMSPFGAYNRFFSL